MGREWDAGSYHRLSGHQYEWGQRVLARLSLRGDETVIDAGCGTGRLTAELAALIPRGRVLAVDLSQNMLLKARESLAETRTRLHLICADLAALPFTTCADGVFSTAAFHWVKDHHRLFQSLFASLKPGGWLLAQCGGGPNLVRMRQRAVALASQPPFAHFFAGWSEPWEYADERTTAARLRAAGFADIVTWLHPAGFSIDSADEYRQYLATVTLHAHVARITDPELREKFLDEMVRQALADPEFHLDYWRLNIQARKPY